MVILIRRGTTPTIQVVLPDELDMSTIVTAWIYINQNGEVIVDRSNDTIEIEDNTLSITLTQEETLALSDGFAFIQVRLLDTDGVALASQENRVHVLPIYKEGEITV